MKNILDLQLFLSNCKKDKTKNNKIGNEILQLIEKGSWPYPLDKFQMEFKAYNLYCEISPMNYSGKIRFYLILAFLFYFILFLIDRDPLLLIGFIFLIVSFNLHLHRIAKLCEQATIFCTHVARYDKGHLSNTPLNQEEKITNTTEIQVLYNLFKEGALTQEEFENQKKKILERVS